MANVPVFQPDYTTYLHAEVLDIKTYLKAAHCWNAISWASIRPRNMYSKYMSSVDYTQLNSLD